MREKSGLDGRRGFTLVELMIALVVGLVAIGAVCSVYAVHQREYRNRQLRLTVQQDLRGALVIMEQQIRLAGYDPEASGLFGITDVRRYDLVDTGVDPNGQPALFYTVDLDESGDPDPRNNHRNREHCSFRIRDDKQTARRYLTWDNGAGRHPLAENIQALGLAYGVDRDGDGRLDTWNGGDHPIWAVDTDDDNRLDTHLDADNNGIVDENDDTDGDLRITAGDGGAIDPPIPPSRIHTVRVWLLAVSPRPLQGHMDQGTYVVGDRIIKASGDGFLRRLAQSTIFGRNL
jgi:type IV pilus assembly protein PilW